MPAEAEQETGAPAAEAGAPPGGEAAPGAEAGPEAPQDGPEPDAPEEPGVEELRAEVEDYRARWMRAVADYQNLRRRSSEERADLRAQLLAGLVRGYLGLLDDLDRALGSLEQHEELSGHAWVDGVVMVRQKFASLLQESGVSEVAAQGERFDPRRHEAVGYQPGPEGQVVAVVQPGFEAGSQVVRPARVVVGDGSGTDEGTQEAGDPEGAGEDPGGE